MDPLSAFHPIQPIFLPLLFLFLFILCEDGFIRRLVVLKREPHHGLLKTVRFIRIPRAQDFRYQTLILLRALPRSQEQ